MVGFTTSAVHQQGSAAMSPISWSSHKVKQFVSASLAGEGFLDERRKGWLNANGSAAYWSRKSIKTTNPRYIDGNRYHYP